MPKRIQLSRRKGWRKPEGVIVVARPSRWGNPFSVTDWGRARAIALFRMAAEGTWNPRELEDVSDPVYRLAYDTRNHWRVRFDAHPLEEIRADLAGHDLACWCPLDQPCHADVLLELANGPA